MGQGYLAVRPLPLAPLGGPREVETFQSEFRDEANVRAALERTGDLHFGDVEPEIVEALSLNPPPSHLIRPPRS
jgi:hypothetical protein